MGLYSFRMNFYSSSLILRVLDEPSCSNDRDNCEAFVAIIAKKLVFLTMMIVAINASFFSVIAINVKV